MALSIPTGYQRAIIFNGVQTTAYGNATSTQSAGSGTSDVAVTANLTGLAPSTTYHYRIVATNSAGTSFGSDETFITRGKVDFDNDGQTDLLWWNKANGNVGVWYMNAGILLP